MDTKNLLESADSSVTDPRDVTSPKLLTIPQNPQEKRLTRFFRCKTMLQVCWYNFPQEKLKLCTQRANLSIVGSTEGWGEAQHGRETTLSASKYGSIGFVVSALQTIPDVLFNYLSNWRTFTQNAYLV
uniref:Uncharacterized protein n=1 Tax=Sphaerodactylus townsendi TaxID=933632 RepID=A0ACB8FFK3_9SAUR